MAWLDAENGLFHFVLAKEDFYYTDSLCRLSLQQNLEWVLRQRGYSRIFRIENIKGCHWKVEAGKRGESWSGDTAEKFQDLLENYLEEFFCDRQRKTAFLIRSDVFAKLFTKAAAGFCEKLECLPKREGIFVIMVPTKEDAVERLFQNSEGIFCSDYFFAVRNHLEKSKAQESIFGILTQEMGECFYRLPEAGREEIRNMLFRNKILGKMEIDCTKAEQLADFLYFYLHSGEFQKELHYPLPCNQKMPLAMMERKLLEEGTLEKISPILEKQKKRIEIEKKKWIFQAAQEQKDRERQQAQSCDILKREGGLAAQSEIELPLYHMMAVQYRDGRRKSFFYPGLYQIPDSEQVRRILLIRRREKSFSVEWNVKGIPCMDSQENGCCEISGSCQVQILSYGKGIAAYLMREDSYKKEWSFEELILEKHFFIESLQKRIIKLIRGFSKGDHTVGRQEIEKGLNQEWIYENGMHFFDFLVTGFLKQEK